MQAGHESHDNENVERGRVAARQSTELASCSTRKSYQTTTYKASEAFTTTMQLGVP